MSTLLDLFSVLILCSTFILIANKRVKGYIKTFRLQSMLIAAAAGTMGIQGLGTGGDFDLLAIALLIVGLKGIYIPNLLDKTYSNVEYRVEKDFFYNIPLLVLISFGLVIFSFFCVSAIEGIGTGPMGMHVVNSVSVILIGLFFMICRKKAIGQIIGFLVIENGLFVTAVFSAHGMPFIVDLGIFIDLITAVMIMGMMVFRINEKFESIDINRLKNLRG